MQTDTGLEEQGEPYIIHKHRFKRIVTHDDLILFSFHCTAELSPAHTPEMCISHRCVPFSHSMMVLEECHSIGGMIPLNHLRTEKPHKALLEKSRAALALH